MPRSKFIDTTEVLLVEQAHHTGLYLAETDVFTKTYARAADVAKAYPDDEFSRFFRLATDYRSAPEEVTEEVAAAWLDANEPDPDGDNTLPAYVANSEAWETYTQNYRREARVYSAMRRQQVA